MNSDRVVSKTIPLIIKNLIIVNALVLLAQYVFRNNPTFSMEDFFALHDTRSVFFRPHQLLTYMFLHSTDSLTHIFFNMFALWMFGAILENIWGPKRFLIFYLLCGLGSAVLHLIVLHYQLTPSYEALQQYPPHDQVLLLNNPNFDVNVPTLGASGAVFGCLAAFGMLFPNSLIYLYFFVPIKAKWFVIGYAAIELFSGIRNSAGDSTAHWAHLGGALVGVIIVLYWRRTDKKNFY